ncbi:MAG: putative zinc-binding metallopeptidase [Segetibacter sp.]
MEIIVKSFTTIVRITNTMFVTGSFRIEEENLFCTACKLNRTIPDISKNEYRQQWNTIENAKHRLVYSLLKMKLPLQSKTIDPENGLSFDFMADEKKTDSRKS